ncbi:hypothetical protein chiPu_0030842, partial [Chiloscyllium punctatum]|nr:hypothetical protein [Chiloscyllium punctatum]
MPPPSPVSLGDALLVRPVVEPDVRGVQVYLPGKGQFWYNVHSHQRHTGPQNLYEAVTISTVSEGGRPARYRGLGQGEGEGDWPITEALGVGERPVTEAWGRERERETGPLLRPGGGRPARYRGLGEGKGEGDPPVTKAWGRERETRPLPRPGAGR